MSFETEHEHDHGEERVCLTCKIREAVDAYAADQGGELEAGNVVARLAEAIASVIISVPDQMQGRLTTFAVRAIEASLRYHETGVVQEIMVSRVATN